MKKIFLALAATALIAGCSSGVKLDNVPVEDRTATAVTPGTGTGSTGVGSGGVNDRTVTPATPTTPDLAAGPATGRIVYFDFNSYVVKPESQSIIENNARFLRANSNRKAVIEGHTDEVGGREYNLALGQRRSEAVRRSLGLLGVPDSQVEAVSFGKEKPAVAGGGEQAQNRRAEITYR